MNKIQIQNKTSAAGGKTRNNRNEHVNFFPLVIIVNPRETHGEEEELFHSLFSLTGERGAVGWKRQVFDIVFRVS